jgi:hypothetical protein
MTIESNAHLAKLFQEFPRGLALIGLRDSRETSTSRLLEVNALAASLVPPSIETVLSAGGASRDRNVEGRKT